MQLANLGRQVESDYRTSTVSAGIDSVPPTLPARNDRFDLFLSLKRFQQKTISAFTYIWTALPRWKTSLPTLSTSILDVSTSIISTSTSIMSTSISIMSTSTSALSLALTTGIQEVSHLVIDYYNCTKLFLQASDEYEELLHGKSKSDGFNQQRSNVPVAVLTPRQRQEAIGSIAGLEPDKITWLAIFLERAKRKIEGTNGDVLSWAHKLWRSYTYFYRLLCLAPVVMIGGFVLLVDGQTLRILALLGILTVMLKEEEVRAWIEAV